MGVVTERLVVKREKTRVVVFRPAVTFAVATTGSSIVKKIYEEKFIINSCSIWSAANNV